jgi:iron complex outermembrane receptor protein
MNARSIRQVAQAVMALGLVLVVPAAGGAQTGQRDLARVSIADLMRMEITSAAKKEQRAEDVAAAVFVITQDDIRRSGLRSLPELFRLVPGMQVAQANSSMWAVSARGFNDVFSNKLLVLIDGRSIYNHVFSGVLWSGEDLMLQDIDRIEVIRGPGGTVWGANAMNGVINIVTKSALDTKGAMVDVTTGTFERHQAAVRYGGSLGGLAYRVYSQWSDHGNSRDDTGASAGDHWNSLATGARADWSRGADAVMAHASFTTGQSRPQWRQLSSPSLGITPSSADVTDARSMTLMGRWVHTRPDGSLFQAQAFRTARVRNDAPLWHKEGIDDVELQYRTAVGARHDLILGGGHRDDDVSTRGTFTLDIPSSAKRTTNVFIQDEISLGERVTVTLGSKLEHDNHAGWGVLPSARAMWSVTPTQRAWAAVSRARRTPSAADLGMRLYVATVPGEAGVPLVFGFAGNPDFLTERLTELEVGYRFQVGSSAAFDVTAFRGNYDRLTTLEPISPSFKQTPEPHLFVPVQPSNLLSANTAGVEIAGHWVPAVWWRLDGSYSGLHVAPHVDASSQDPAAAAFDGNAPQHQWQLHSSIWPAPRIRFDGSLYHVGRLRQVDAEAYTRADARLEFTISDRLSAIAAGQNLFNPAHPEYPAVSSLFVSTAMPRSGTLSLSWTF